MWLRTLYICTILFCRCNYPFASTDAAKNIFFTETVILLPTSLELGERKHVADKRFSFIYSSHQSLLVQKFPTQNQSYPHMLNSYNQEILSLNGGEL